MQHQMVVTLLEVILLTLETCVVVGLVNSYMKILIVLPIAPLVTMKIIC